MPVYHSSWNEEAATQACGCSILPIQTTARGPAGPMPPSAAGGAGSEGRLDIVGEALNYFRANVFFKNFEIKGPADRVLVYLTLFTHFCISKVATMSEADGRRELQRISIAKPVIPGEAGFPLTSMFQEPSRGEEAELCRSYLQQCRQTLIPRLIEKLYVAGQPPNKFWLAFSKRNFMGKKLTQ